MTRFLDMRKRRNLFCGFSRESCGVLEESIVPASNDKGFRISEILNMLDDDGNNDTQDSTVKEKSQSGAKKRAACSTAPSSSFGRCLALLTSESSKCCCDERNFSRSKSKLKSDSTAARIKASTNSSSVKKSVCRKLDFQFNKAVAPKLPSGEQNSINFTSADSKHEIINAPETPSIPDESLVDQNMPNPSSAVFRSSSRKGDIPICSAVFRSSSRKGDSPICPARVVPELPYDGVILGAERYRKKSPKHLNPKKAKPSEGQEIMVSRSLFVSAGPVFDSHISQVDSKMAAVNARNPALEKTCKPTSSLDQIASAVHYSPLKSKDEKHKDYQETGESRAFLKKQKAASGLPALSSKDALNRGLSGFRGFRKPCDEPLFNFGLGFGVVFMVTSSKKEIEKLRELQKQTERLLKDLKQEASRRNFSNDSAQIELRGENLLSEYRYGERKIEDTKDRMAFASHSSGRLESGISGNECNSSAHSIITTESTPRHSGMAQLEAELEAELERMELNLTAERSCQRGIFSDSEMPDNIVYNDLDVSGIPGKKSNHDQEDMDITNYSVPPIQMPDNIVYNDLNVSGIPGKKSNHDQEDMNRTNYSVSPIELERRLHELLQTRQEDHIAELEADLKITEDELLDKEKELSWWKECVWKLLQENNETTTPGDDSIASVFTSNAETLNCSEDIASASSSGALDVRDKSSNSDSLLADFSHLVNLQTKRKHANSSSVQNEAQIQTFGSNSSENGEGAERKENALLYTRKKAACADNLQNYSKGRELFINVPSTSKNIGFQQAKELTSNSVLNTPLGNANVNINSGRRGPRPPVLSKIKHWEALSRGETLSTQSCDMDDHLLASCHHSLVSGNVNSEAKCWVSSVNHGKRKQGSFGCAEQDTVGIKFESFSV